MIAPWKLNKSRLTSLSHSRFFAPIHTCVPDITPLVSRGDRPLTLTFEHQLEMLVFYHLHGYQSGAELLQAMEEDDFAKEHIAPPEGIKKSAFYEALSDRGILQLQEVFEKLYARAKKAVPSKYGNLGKLVAVDGSLVDATLSMYWAEYRENSNKFKAHVGFNVNQGIPQKLHLTEGKAGERPFVSRIVNPGETAILDRGYQDHADFDQWREDDRHFVCRIKGNTVKQLVTLERFEIDSDSFVFFDGTVLLGQGRTQTKKPLRMVGYRVNQVTYYVVTDRMDLTAEEVATVYKLRWQIEKFFAWWKKRLKVYHLISRSTQGVLVQILAGLITYLLMAIYCAEEHGERVSMKRVRQLRNRIQNELRSSQMQTAKSTTRKRQKKRGDQLDART
jgi:hypothetical protein